MNRKRLLLLFLGNILRGDDGVGIELQKRILRRDLPENVKIEEGSTGGMILLGIMEDYDTVLVVDAVDTGDFSKNIVIFSPRETEAGSVNTLSLHSVSIQDIIRFNEALGEKVPEIIIFGVQVRDIGEHIGLSPEVSSNLDKAEEELYNLIIRLSSR